MNLTRSLLIAVLSTIATAQSMLDVACPCTARPSCSRVFGEGEDFAEEALVGSLPACGQGQVRCCTRDDMFRTLSLILGGGRPAVPAATNDPLAELAKGLGGTSAAAAGGSLGAGGADPSVDPLADLARGLGGGVTPSDFFGQDLGSIQEADPLADLARTLSGGSTGAEASAADFFGLQQLGTNAGSDSSADPLAELARTLGGSSSIAAADPTTNFFGSDQGAAPGAADPLAELARMLNAAGELGSDPRGELSRMLSRLQQGQSRDRSALFESLAIPGVEPVADNGRSFFGADDERSLLAAALAEVEQFSPDSIDFEAASSQDSSAAAAFSPFQQQAAVSNGDSATIAAQEEPTFSSFPPLAAAGLQQPDLAAALSQAAASQPAGAVTIPDLIFPPELPSAAPAIPPVAPTFTPSLPAAAPVAPTFTPSLPVASPVAPTFTPSLPAAPPVAPTFTPSLPATQPRGQAAPAVNIIGPRPVYISNDVVKGPTVGSPAGGQSGGNSHGGNVDIAALLAALRQIG